MLELERVNQVEIDIQYDYNAAFIYRDEYEYRLNLLDRYKEGFINLHELNNLFT